MAKAQTDNDKLDEARRKDFEANFDKNEDVANQTAAHVDTLPSDLDGHAVKYSLTGPEAAEFHDRTEGGTKNVDKVLEEIRAGRYVNRQAYVRTPAGTSSPFDRTTVPVPPAPPAVEALDPHAPGPQDPTGHVLEGVAEPTDQRKEEVKAAGGSYVEAADEVTEDVDATAADNAE